METEMERCRNCEEVLKGPFCHHCGQDQRNYIREVWKLVPEFLGEFSNWDGRLWRTLIPLWYRPGYLTRRYVDGHRAPYVPPLRLYIFTSILAFLVLSQAIGPLPPAQLPPGAAEMSAPPEFNLPFLSDSLEKRLVERVGELAASPDRLLNYLLSLAPQVMLVMLPLFALWLKVVYLGRGHFYMEHLLLALHTHSLVLQLMIVNVLLSLLEGALARWPLLASLPSFLGLLLIYWAPIYLLLSQKRYYAQGWGKTLVRFVLAGFGYLLMFSASALATLVYGLLNA